jgi:hypothetical protein
MKYAALVILALTTAGYAQMEMRDTELYQRSEFRKLAPAVGAKLAELKLKDLNGKEVSLSSLYDKPLVIIPGAYT